MIDGMKATRRRRISRGTGGYGALGTLRMMPLAIGNPTLQTVLPWALVLQVGSCLIASLG